MARSLLPYAHIIAAHAYNIPAAYVEFELGIKGDGTKFQDHYESIGLKAEKSTVEDPKFTTGSFDMEKIADFFRSDWITKVQRNDACKSD